MSEPPINVEMDGAAERGPRAKQLVIGLDIGTMFSGVSFQVHDKNGQHVSEAENQTVRAWPSSHGNQIEGKVPSAIHVDGDGDTMGWGYTADDGEGTKIEWYKLALADEDIPPHIRDSAKLTETKEKMRNLGINAGQVMKHYMYKIWEHAQEGIKKSVGRRDFESIPIHVVITIPAIWSNQAIQAMRVAAAASILQSRHAGITTYEFLSEPEAAVQAYAKKLQLKLEVDDIVMVVDLGGGTGDVISYLKSGEGGEAHLELEEAVPGDGDLCGAIFVDEAFKRLLFNRLPAEHRDLKAQNPGAWRRILSEQWEHSIKRSFTWKDNFDFWKVVLSNLAPDVDAVLLREAEIRDVFESSVMPKIISLINRQIEKIKTAHGGKVPRVILPVGGFGRCPYVLQRLREEFEDSSVTSRSTKQSRKKKKQLQPQEEIEIHSEEDEMPWTAVCRGACLFGMRAQLNTRLVKSRSSRISVGFRQNEPGTAEEGGIWMPEYNCYMIPDYMNWIVKKGDSISTDRKSSMAMYLSFDPGAKGMHTEHSTFWAYDGDSPPRRHDEEDPGFQHYGVMTITVPKPIQQLRFENTDNGGSRVFDYNLQIEIVGGSVQITATSTDRGDGGKEVGKLTLRHLDRL